MNELSHREWRQRLGGLAVGRLEGDDLVALRAHLDGCPECRAELTELYRTVEMLDLVDPADVDDVPAPPPDLGDRVVRHVLDTADRRAAHRTRGLLLAAAVVALLAVGAGVGWVLRPVPEVAGGPPTEPVTVQIQESAVHAGAELINHTWGVEIVLTADGFDLGEQYRVQMISRTGDRSSAGEFVGTGTSPMVCNLNSSVLRPDAAGFEILDQNGSVVLRSDFV